MIHSILVFSFSLFLTSQVPAANAAESLSRPKDPPVVAAVDLQAYAGKWYEIAHSPNFFQRACESSTAEYEVINPHTISVFNTCYQGGKVIKTIRGRAWVRDPSEPGKLVVKFNRWYIPKGDYWISELDPNYQWAVVSSPKKKFTFILARTPILEESLKTEILNKLKANGFNTDQFIFDQGN